MCERQSLLPLFECPIQPRGELSRRMYKRLYIYWYFKKEH